MVKKIDYIEQLNQVHSFDLNLATREIYLHSHYIAVGPDSEEGGIEYRMATQFIKNLHILNLISDESILVHLQSPGGEWGHGMAIFDAIQASESPVFILGYGEISSMSGIIFQAAYKRIMMPNCEMMIHRGFLTLDGVSATVQTNAAWNKKTDFKMLQIYAARANMGTYFTDKKMSERRVINFIDKKIQKLGDWNLDANEAICYGLCDGVFGTPGFETIDKIRKL